MVMPMCYDGVNDMFEAAPWNLTQYETACAARWKVGHAVTAMIIRVAISRHWSSHD